MPVNLKQRASRTPNRRNLSNPRGSRLLDLNDNSFENNRSRYSNYNPMGEINEIYNAYKLPPERLIPSQMSQKR